MRFQDDGIWSTQSSQTQNREACIQQSTCVILRLCPAGLRSRPPAVEGRRPQLMDNFRAAAAGGRAAKALPPMYYAGRLAPSATDNITNAMTFDHSMSQVNESVSESTSRERVSLTALLAAAC